MRKFEDEARPVQDNRRSTGTARSSRPSTGIRVALPLTALLWLCASVVLLAGPARAMDISGSLGSTAGNCGTYDPTDPSLHTLMIGDSITAGGKVDLEHLRPHWEINAKAGRNVDCLPMLVSERLNHGYLGRLVIALGTNAVQGWGQDDYQMVVDMVPARTVVLFVTTYRNRDLWPSTNPYRTRASVQYFYSHEMENIACARPNTCVVPWRQYAMKHPTMLRDGVHPTVKGREAWASMIDDAAEQCVPE